MTKYVPDLERCKKLRDKGFPQDTEFYWGMTEIRTGKKSNLFHEWFVVSKGRVIEAELHREAYYKTIAAPLTDELLRELPDGSLLQKFMYQSEGLLANIHLYEALDTDTGISKTDENPPNALADLYLSLEEK
jgi:hypothetical protein